MFADSLKAELLLGYACRAQHWPQAGVLVAWIASRFDKAAWLRSSWLESVWAHHVWFADILRAELLKTDTPIHVEASLVRTSTPAFFQAYEFKVALASEFHRRHAR